MPQMSGCSLARGWYRDFLLLCLTEEIHALELLYCHVGLLASRFKKITVF